MISYSGDGYSLPVDIQLRGRDKEQINRFAQALFRYTIELGGRIFMAKNDFLLPDMFRQMYPRYNEFIEVKKQLDPLQIFLSDMYRRLMQVSL